MTSYEITKTKGHLLARLDNIAKNIDLMNESLAFLSCDLAASAQETFDLCLADDLAGLDWLLKHITKTIDQYDTEIVESPYFSK